MERQTEVRETGSFCTFQFFDCLSAKPEDAPRRFSVYPSIKREKNVLYQQPHLVEPMKLRVYEDLPATPNTPEPSHLTLWGRNLASRASSRTSRMSFTKKRTTSKTMISRPQPIAETTNDLPFRRRREFTPLQLSIYVDARPLSDLPQFDRFSFTDTGELKLPPKALVRTQSDSMLRKPEAISVTIPNRSNSMFETGDIVFARPGTSYSVVSTSRPPSEYDALHSHPVSWSSLPGIPAPKSQKSENIVAVLTPMQEEFSPEATSITVDGTVLKMPPTMQGRPFTASSRSPPTPGSQAPFPVIGRGYSNVSTQSKRPIFSSHSQTSHRAQKRISQWLQYRTNSQSTSTVETVSTTISFAEHRRKRSEFYKLGQQMQVPNMTVTSPPQPLNFSKAFPPQHVRTNTESTSQTVDTSVLSSTFDDDSSRSSQDSATTYSAGEVKSRTGTIKSISSPSGLKIITPDQRDVLVSPPPTAEIVPPSGIYLSEINGHLRSPGVGIAF